MLASSRGASLLQPTDFQRPNQRLQRTRMRAPLSRKPFGAAVKNRAGVGTSPYVGPRSTGHAFTVSSPLQRPTPGLIAHRGILRG